MCFSWQVRIYTLPETSIAPETRPSQKEIHLPIIHFQGLNMLVSGRVNGVCFLSAATIKIWSSLEQKGIAVLSQSVVKSDYHGLLNW